MYALTQLVAGLLFAHAAWALCFVTGTLLDDCRPSQSAGSGIALLRVVAITLGGMALWGFAAFVLGSIGLLTPVGLILALACVFAAFPALHRQHPFARSFWNARRQLIAKAFCGPGAFVYVAALLLSAPAVIPDFSADGVQMHLAYAYDWAHAGRIYAEMRMRFPYYALNTELLYALTMVAGAGRYVTFVSWLSGTLAALGTTAIVTAIDERVPLAAGRWSRWAARSVYVIAALWLMLAAVFLRWWPTGMTDATGCAFFLGATASCAAVWIDRDERWLRLLVVPAAFLAGIKPSYLFFVPLFLIAVWVIAGRLAVGRRRVAILVAALCVLAAPWYVRNLILDGDPIPPVLNLALRGHDPSFTKRDWAAIRADQTPKRTLRDWELYPLDEWRNPLTIAFREYGVTAVVFSLYIIAFAAPLLSVKTRKTPQEAALAWILGCTAFGMLYLILSSSLTRYTLLIYPTMCASAGSLLLMALRRIPDGVLAAPVIALLALVPSPVSHEFYREYWGVYYQGLAQVMPSDDAALDRFLGGYREARPLLDAPVLKDRGTDTVLLVQTDLNYYVELHGAKPLGDWTGPGRYADLLEAIDEDRVREYAEEHRVGAVVAAENAIVPEELDYLRRQLLADGFTELPSSDAAYAAFLRSRRVSSATEKAPELRSRS